MDGSVIIKAVLDTVDVSKNIKALERDLQGISWKNITEGDEKAAKLSSSFKKAGTAATLTLTAPVVAAGKAVFGVASDYEQANARIAAAFGVSGEEAERFSGIGKRIYEGGWGQSLDEVNDALVQCKSTLRDVSDEDLQTVTTNALMLSQTFGADVNESIRGTNALMEGFGLSATEASDLLTAGMQRGLNYTDELGDNLSEYSVRWGEAGMSASEYFSLLEAGTSNGAYNLDKVGDYLNEFLTALADGRMEVPAYIQKDSPLGRELPVNVKMLIENRKENTALRIKACLYGVMDALCKAATPARHPAGAEHRDTRLLRQTVQYVDRHYAEKITVAAISAQCGYSSSHFMKRFHDLTGTSFAQYLIHFRLEKAATLLRGSRYTVLEIAARCGFSNASYFTRAFTRQYGVSPTAYRQSGDKTDD